MTLADLPQIHSLPAREKLQLLDELWMDVSNDVDTRNVTEEEKSLLDERWNQFLSNPLSALNLAEFKTRLNALRA